MGITLTKMEIRLPKELSLFFWILVRDVRCEM